MSMQFLQSPNKGVVLFSILLCMQKLLWTTATGQSSSANNNDGSENREAAVETLKQDFADWLTVLHNLKEGIVQIEGNPWLPRLFVRKSRKTGKVSDSQSSQQQPPPTVELRLARHLEEQEPRLFYQWMRAGQRAKRHREFEKRVKNDTNLGRKEHLRGHLMDSAEAVRQAFNDFAHELLGDWKCDKYQRKAKNKLATKSKKPMEPGNETLNDLDKFMKQCQEWEALAQDLLAYTAFLSITQPLGKTTIRLQFQTYNLSVVSPGHIREQHRVIGADFLRHLCTRPHVQISGKSTTWNNKGTSAQEKNQENAIALSVESQGKENIFPNAKVAANILDLTGLLLEAYIHAHEQFSRKNEPFRKNAQQSFSLTVSAGIDEPRRWPQQQQELMEREPAWTGLVRRVESWRQAFAKMDKMPRKSSSLVGKMLMKRGKLVVHLFTETGRYVRFREDFEEIRAECVKLWRQALLREEVIASAVNAVQVAAVPLRENVPLEEYEKNVSLNRVLLTKWQQFGTVVNECANEHIPAPAVDSSEEVNDSIYWREQRRKTCYGMAHGVAEKVKELKNRMHKFTHQTLVKEYGESVLDGLRETIDSFKDAVN